MRWEFDIWFRVWHFAVLRRIDEEMTATSKRWAIGWHGSYYDQWDKAHKRSWRVVRELW